MNLGTVLNVNLACGGLFEHLVTSRMALWLESHTDGKFTFRTVPKFTGDRGG